MRPLSNAARQVETQAGPVERQARWRCSLNTHAGRIGSRTRLMSNEVFGKWSCRVRSAIAVEAGAESRSRMWLYGVRQKVLHECGDRRS